MVYCVHDAKVVVIDYPGGVDEKKVFRSSLPSFKVIWVFSWRFASEIAGEASKSSLVSSSTLQP